MKPSLMFALAWLAGAQVSSMLGAEVRLQRAPAGALQPQAVMDAQGTLHLVYLKGEPKACDVFYSRRERDAGSFAPPLRVNSQPGSAVAVGTIRGAQLALGKGGRVHVVWNGSHQATPKPPTQGAPLLYTRMTDPGTAFEPQRNLINTTQHLDGGGTVAADLAGNVYVLWHSAPPGNQAGEAGRGVFLARSQDEGRTFAAERSVNPEPTGACACCGMRAGTDAEGNLFALYRTAASALNRDMTLLVSRDQGGRFTSTTLHRWRLGQCPMSSEFLTAAGGKMLAAWETDGPVQFASLGAPVSNVPVAQRPATVAKGKHPVLAVNASGQTLLVWTEGTAWQRGGALAWQVFGPDGRTVGEPQRRDGVPVWSLAAAVAEPDGGFTILY
ncbi:MAG: hypothetical protein B9S33_04520 [Pedosphaera sp. Tous-C6FEB]|nr:MAG: hypothetical protein B9S33_04520 [Pedosphaera sp. Tous-C6FEB]